jgi:hypothetical protein
MKRLLLALLIGCAFTLVLVMTLKLRADAGLSHLLRNGADALLFPGYVVSLALSLGRFHDIRFGVVESANAAIYSGLAYLIHAGLEQTEDQIQRSSPGSQGALRSVRVNSGGYTYDAPT